MSAPTLPARLFVPAAPARRPANEVSFTQLLAGVGGADLTALQAAIDAAIGLARDFPELESDVGLTVEPSVLTLSIVVSVPRDQASPVTFVSANV